MGRKKATIKEVAKEAGVSIATVSRVINKNYYVSPEIEEKVRSAVATTGYYPDSIARTMKSNTTHMIGFIVSDISNPHLMSIARAIEDVVRESTYNLLVCSTETDEKLERRYIEAFISRRISGIILHSTGTIDEFTARVSHDIPMTLVYRHNEDRTFVGDTVDTNGTRGTYDLTKHLLHIGHKRIGVINGYSQFSTSRNRWKGFCLAVQEAGLLPDEKLVYYGDFTEAAGYKGAEHLLSLQKPPSAILCMNNVVAFGALKYLRIAGIRIPEDVSLVNYGEIDNVELMSVQPTRVPQNPWSLGKKAGELIIDRIKNPSRPNREVIFDAEIIYGNSVGPPKE
jgi:LacI family transcriptional regulator